MVNISISEWQLILVLFEIVKTKVSQNNYLHSNKKIYSHWFITKAIVYNSDVTSFTSCNPICYLSFENEDSQTSAFTVGQTNLTWSRLLTVSRTAFWGVPAIFRDWACTTVFRKEINTNSLKTNSYLSTKQFQNEVWSKKCERNQ